MGPFLSHSDHMTRYVANQDLTIDIQHIGRSREPVLVIDDFLTDPAALVAAAATASDWADLPPGGYPGRRAALPAEYVRATLRRLDPIIRDKVLARPAQLDRFECSFSLVTKAPDDLAPLQRVPHIDIARENRVAVLHYLCGPEFGGTAFFRQSETGLEQIGPATRARYLESRTKGLAALTGGHRYPSERTPGYDRTGFTTARFNRLVAYRSFTLHSGMIDRPDLLSDDPKRGRLTANFFVDYTPTQSA